MEEKGTTEDEMVGWHHRLSGRELEQALRDSEGQGSLVCCSPWGRKVRHDWGTEQPQSLHYKLKAFSSGLGWRKESGSFFVEWQDNEQQATQAPIWKLIRVLEWLHVRVGWVLEMSCFNFSPAAPILQAKTKERRYRKRSSVLLSSLIDQKVLRTQRHRKNTE